MHKYMYVHTANVIKGPGTTIGAGNKNIIAPKGEFGTILTLTKEKVKEKVKEKPTNNKPIQKTEEKIEKE